MALSKEENEEEKQESNKEEINAKNVDEKKKTNNKKGGKKFLIISVIIIILIGALAGGYFYYILSKPKFKDVNIELGTNSVTLDDFLLDDIYKENCELVTDLSTINYETTGTYEIELKYKNIKQKVNLNIVDTVAPEVEFQNLNKYVDYKLNADDFIKSKSDLSEMTATISNPPEIKGIGKYEVLVEVKDSSNNVTSKSCELNVTRVVTEYTLELGKKLKKENVLLNKADANTISQSDIDAINKKGVGEYKLVSNIGGQKETIKIIVKDTTAPKLVLKNVSIYDDEKVSGKSAFIKSVSDASKVTTTLKTTINYSKLGSQNIVIEAVDASGNKTQKTATLTIKKDTDAPIFYGLSNISIKRGGSVNFKSGVKAVDAKDGNVSFTVDTSKVNLNSAGTYYAKYTAKDKKGNSTTKSRKITVQHNQTDTNNKFNTFYNNYLAGKSVSGIVSTIRSKIRYNSNWGGDDPIWYGLTNNIGNCYVHALLVKKALDKQGITNQLIYITDKTHYWNLVYSGGVWRHYDATPTAHIQGPATDTEKANSSAMHGRKWSSSFPKAK